MSYVVLPSYLSANLSLKYILKNMIFSLNLRNLFNQRYHAFDGYYDDDGFKLALIILTDFNFEIIYFFIEKNGIYLVYLIHKIYHINYGFKQ